MKTSFYNHYFSQQHGIICYNSLTDAYLILKEIIYSDFEANKNSLEQFKLNHSAQYEILYQNGFIVEDDYDEKEYFLNMYYERKLTRNFYNLIVNPTLSCNLNCWYCYENHKTKSELSNETEKRILLHIRKKYEADKFEYLYLSFFGGEPFLKPKIVSSLIDGVNEIAVEKNFKLIISFTTNATILPDTLLTQLKHFNTSFQITLDGNKQIHNSIRNFRKKNELGTYDIILQNIKRITEKLIDYSITLRVNFTSSTLIGLESIIDDLDFCDRKKTAINLQKVWQTNEKDIDKQLLFDFINYAKTHNFIVHYMDLYPKLSVCYADDYNQAVINYNGDVFKCTARDFSTIEPEGKLLENGTILWNTKKMLNRISLRLPEICENCNLLPACGSYCSQVRLEQGDSLKCRLDKDFTKEDYIIHNLNRQLITKKILS